MLARSDVDALFREAVGFGMNPTECTLRRKVDWSGIYHEKSGSQFLVRPRNVFANSRNNRFQSYDAKATVGSERETTYESIQWFSVTLIAQDWARRVASLSTWAGSEQARDAFNAAQGMDTENAPFTKDEQKQIAAQLAGITTYLQEEHDLPSEQLAQINEELKKVAEASERMGRKDWLIYFLGTITALVMTATVAAPVGEHIFIIVIHGLAHLFNGEGGPPQIPSKLV
jgi:hypothetical protein